MKNKKKQYLQTDWAKLAKRELKKENTNFTLFLEECKTNSKYTKYNLAELFQAFLLQQK